MDVFLVIENNGEPFEDNYEYVDSVFCTYAGADSYVTKNGYVFEEKSGHDEETAGMMHKWRYRTKDGHSSWRLRIEEWRLRE